LKKYTSATSLLRGISLYSEFIAEFERATKSSNASIHIAYAPPIDFGEDIKCFLQYLRPMELARPLITVQEKKHEAFESLKDGVMFLGFIWGRRYQEAMAGEPGNLLYDIGYRWFPETSVDVFKKAALSADLISLALTTINKRSRLYLCNPRETTDIAPVMRWTYVSIFFDSIAFNGVPPIVFPPHLPSCPPPNANSDGQIWSGQTIPVTGIWEPWPIDPSIGPRCPNYYLAGDTASQYQLEGTDTLEDVRWRLIWKDTRYADGTIPHEEQEYFAPPPPAVRNRRMLTAYPGDVCPRSGEWFSHHLKRRINVQAGEPMPGPERGKTGAVIWYLELDD
ncbi:Imm72 family immunity protein, partial [Caballeronia grimmiae]